tara:strand:+ start:279 stop:398 length:120 start_codon:yes stop_codon:yes gene_type:complete
LESDAGAPTTAHSVLPASELNPNPEKDKDASGERTVFSK